MIWGLANSRGFVFCLKCFLVSQKYNTAWKNNDYFLISLIRYSVVALKSVKTLIRFDNFAIFRKIYVKLNLYILYKLILSVTA